jgi:hypothetical protein
VKIAPNDAKDTKYAMQSAAVIKTGEYAEYSSGTNWPLLTVAEMLYGIPVLSKDTYADMGRYPVKNTFLTAGGVKSCAGRSGRALTVHDGHNEPEANHHRGDGVHFGPPLYKSVRKRLRRTRVG